MTEETKMMRPVPRSTMCSNAGCAMKNEPDRFTARTVFHSSTDIFMAILSMVIPALLTRMSILPCSSRTSWTTRRQSSGRETLPWWTLARPWPAKSSSSSLRNCSARSRLPLYPAATDAPWLARLLQIAAPMPRVPPVTRATFPESFWPAMAVDRWPDVESRAFMAVPPRIDYGSLTMTMLALGVASGPVTSHNVVRRWVCMIDSRYCWQQYRVVCAPVATLELTHHRCLHSSNRCLTTSLGNGSFRSWWPPHVRLRVFTTPRTSATPHRRPIDKWEECQLLPSINTLGRGRVQPRQCRTRRLRRTLEGRRRTQARHARLVQPHQAALRAVPPNPSRPRCRVLPSQPPHGATARGSWDRLTSPGVQQVDRGEVVNESHRVLPDWRSRRFATCRAIGPGDSSRSGSSPCACLRSEPDGLEVPQGIGPR